MNKTKIQLLGHATFKITSPEGKIIIIDPWLTDNPFIPKQFKKQEIIDLMLVTHGHDDHFDKNIIDIINRTKSKVIANNICRWYLLEKGVPDEVFESLNIGGTVSLMDIDVTVVNANHIGHISISDDKIGYIHPSVGYIVKFSDGLKIYFAGDTSIFSDMQLIGQIYKPDIAVLPIGGQFTMGPVEASHAVRLLNVKHVIPCHYGTFHQLTGSPEELRELTKDIPNLEIHALNPGEELLLT